MVKSSFLLTRPNYDQTTNYLFYWAELVLKSAKSKKILTFDLADDQANRKNFEKSLKKHKPTFIFLNGHGSASSVTGNNGEILLSFAKNEELVKKKVVYALSCQSAKRLGKSCVSSGCVSYLGYDEDFIFCFEEDKQNSPLDDKTAGYFLAPAVNLAVDTVEGKTTGEAFENSQESFKQNIVKFSLSDSTPEERELLPYLVWDFQHQVCLGDQKAKCEFILEEEYRKQNIKKLIIIGAVIVFLALVLVLFKLKG